ncbi:MAG: hypothetical protein IT334_06170 [Thermomicrobiales bacterium]|nr:hypothetical protein [Thermomicrobiales bacterium]
MLHDAVLGIISRESLPDVLTIIHRSGLGPQAKVLDPERGDLARQLTLAGLIDPPLITADAGVEMVLVVFAGGRVQIAIDAMQRFAGREIQLLDRSTSTALPASTSRAMPKRRYQRPLKPVPRYLQVSNRPEP